MTIAFRPSLSPSQASDSVASAAFWWLRRFALRCAQSRTSPGRTISRVPCGLSAAAGCLPKSPGAGELPRISLIGPRTWSSGTGESKSACGFCAAHLL